MTALLINRLLLLFIFITRRITNTHTHIHTHTHARSRIYTHTYKRKNKHHTHTTHKHTCTHTHIHRQTHIHTHTTNASYKIYMLRRLMSLGTAVAALKGVYIACILPKLMYASSAWSSSLNLSQQNQLEKVQKRASKIFLDLAFRDYASAPFTLCLPRLSLRKFIEGLLKHP